MGRSRHYKDWRSAQNSIKSRGFYVVIPEQYHQCVDRVIREAWNYNHLYVNKLRQKIGELEKVLTENDGRSIAEMMIDGDLCQGCGIYTGKDFPNYCDDCE